MILSIQDIRLPGTDQDLTLTVVPCPGQPNYVIGQVKPLIYLLCHVIFSMVLSMFYCVNANNRGYIMRCSSYFIAQFINHSNVLWTVIG